MRNKAYDIRVRRMVTGCDYTVRLFAKDPIAAGERAKVRALQIEWQHSGIRTTPDQYRVVTCEVSSNQNIFTGN